MEDVWEELYGGHADEAKKGPGAALNTEQGNNCNQGK